MKIRYTIVRSILVVASLCLLTSCSLLNRHDGGKTSFDSKRSADKNGVLDVSNIRNTTSLRYFTNGPDKASSNFFDSLSTENKKLMIEGGRATEKLFSSMSDLLEVPFGFRRNFSAGFTSSPAVLATTRIHQGNPIIIQNPTKIHMKESNEVSSILAHEMGHHYLKHNLGSCSKENELEADQFAGFYFGMIEGAAFLRDFGPASIQTRTDQIIRLVHSDYRFIPSHLEDQVLTHCHPSRRDREFWFVQGKVEGLSMSIGWPRELALQNLPENEDHWVMKMVDERN